VWSNSPWTAPALFSVLAICYGVAYARTRRRVFGIAAVLVAIAVIAMGFNAASR
jgi:hypothetical protein